LTAFTLNEPVAGDGDGSRGAKVNCVAGAYGVLITTRFVGVLM
jgi:hypothetical protein